MRIVTDTNVLVSAVLWRGTPHKLLDRIRSGDATLFTCQFMMDELADVLGRTKFVAILAHAATTSEAVLQEFQRLWEVVEAKPLPNRACRDPDDDHVIACALAARADAIISGDRDLLELGAYDGIPILTAAGALARVAQP